MNKYLEKIYNDIYDYISNNIDIKNFLEQNFYNKNIKKIESYFEIKKEENKFGIFNHAGKKEEDYYFSLEIHTCKYKGKDALKLNLIIIPKIIRKKGIGSKLISIIENNIKNTEISLFIVTFVKKDAEKFYEKLGFKKDGDNYIKEI